ncbi:hypothetical protein, partial [Burkholderia sp. Se-20378]|uniref:hypothetical protein n=1 Tax=Burkholderia sp. Se-20378 TaxID=2703899 RepID=UPI001981E602
VNVNVNVNVHANVHANAHTADRRCQPSVRCCRSFGIPVVSGPHRDHCRSSPATGCPPFGRPRAGPSESGPLALPAKNRPAYTFLDRSPH